MKEPPSFKLLPMDDGRLEDLDSLMDQLSERHHQARENFLFQCLAKAKKIENVLHLPLDQLRAFGKVVTSQANPNAMAFTWKGKFVSCLCWDKPGYNYHVVDEPQFPAQEDSL